jgi:hypothetical protein
MSSTDGEIKQRDRAIAENEEARKNVGAFRVSAFAIGIAFLIGIAAFGWVALH